MRMRTISTIRQSLEWIATHTDEADYSRNIAMRLNLAEDVPGLLARIAKLEAQLAETGKPSAAVTLSGPPADGGPVGGNDEKGGVLCGIG